MFITRGKLKRCSVRKSIKMSTTLVENSRGGVTRILFEKCIDVTNRKLSQWRAKHLLYERKKLFIHTKYLVELAIDFQVG